MVKARAKRKATERTKADQATYPDTWASGNGLADIYFRERLRQKSDLEALNNLKDVVKTICESHGWGECMRGLVEGLHEHYAAEIRQPDVQSPSVQGQLGDAYDAIQEAGYILESIRLAANSIMEENSIAGVIQHAAKRGEDVSGVAVALIEAVKEHRPAEEPQT